MGNFILGLIICSSVYNTCLEPYHWPDKFNNHYECMIFGYDESMKKAKEYSQDKDLRQTYGYFKRLKRTGVQIMPRAIPCTSSDNPGFNRDSLGAFAPTKVRARKL